MGRKRLDDIHAITNILNSQKSYKRNYKHKVLLIPFKIDEINLRFTVNVSYNILTQISCIGSCGISYKKITIYPRTNQKIECVNRHALDILKYRREQALKVYYKSDE